MYFIAPGFTPYGLAPLFCRNGTTFVQSIEQTVALAIILGASGKSAIMNRTSGLDSSPQHSEHKTRA
uniref:Uncharacterized protein n=1 Tax=Arion vulgaris TaxID=1028688 RepID=A0A0B7BSN4_9EUPU